MNLANGSQGHVITPTSSPHAVLRRAHRRGFAVLAQAADAAVETVLRALGEVIHVFDVRHRPGSCALVTSNEALPPHTDHHRARWVVLHCHTPAAIGGESILVDAREAFGAITAKHRATLAEVVLFEHCVFEGDPKRYPIVSIENREPQFYFSNWLSGRDLGGDQLAAFKAFGHAVSSCSLHVCQLAAGDLLVVDNRWMLHGRRAFAGTERQLRRYWVEERTHINGGPRVRDRGATR